jgi:hypothetical protein
MAKRNAFLSLIERSDLAGVGVMESEQRRRISSSGLCITAEPFLARRNAGQIAPLMLVAILAICIIAIVSYNASRSTISKMELVNAADAAAYSSAVQAAQSMNFMAYTNRAMVANTIAAGYMTAYVSQLRYQNQLVMAMLKPRRLLAQIIAITADARLEQMAGYADADNSIEEQSALLDESYEDSAGRRPGETNAQYNRRLRELNEDKQGMKNELAQGNPNYDPNRDRRRDNLGLHESDTALEDSRSFEGQNKFQRGGHAGGKILDDIVSILGYSTIPYIDMINLAYSGIQMTEYAKLSGAMKATMSDVAKLYGEDITATESLPTSSDALGVLGWMLPVRTGMDALNTSIDLEVPLKLRRTLESNMGRRGNKAGKFLGTIFGAVLDNFNRGQKVSGKNPMPLSPMQQFISNSVTLDEAMYMDLDRSERFCIQQLFGMWGIPTASIPFNFRYDNKLFDMSPPCFAPFVGGPNSGFGNVALDLAGTTTYVQGSQQGQDDGAKIVADQQNRMNGNPIPAGRLQGEHQPLLSPNTTLSDGSNNERARLEPLSLSQRASRGSSAMAKFADSRLLGGVMGAAAETALNSFLSGLYNTDVGRDSNLEKMKNTLFNGVVTGADWQSKDEFRIGMWIWNLKWQARWFPLKIYETLMASGYSLNKNDELVSEMGLNDINLIAGAGATAKEFWPFYQGVPFYMALMEMPWSDGVLNAGGANQDQRQITVEVSRPMPKTLDVLSRLAPDPHEAGNTNDRLELRAKAKSEVFYFRQPNDAHYNQGNATALTGTNKKFQYFHVPAHNAVEQGSPGASIINDNAFDGVPWFEKIKNWYGDRWGKRQVKLNGFFLGVLKPNIGVSKELPSLMTPFWDARLIK